MSTLPPVCITGLSIQRIVVLVGFLYLFVPTLASAAPNGEKLYLDNCSACHGMSGAGGVGVPLALPAFLENVTDEFLHTTIRNGRPGRVMPSFQTLSDAQVSAIIRHIRSWQTTDTPSNLQYPTFTAGNVAKGAQLFTQHCAVCHGAEGHGGKGTGVTFSRKRDLPIIAPALNNSGFLRAASNEMLLHTIQTGREGTPMPAFAKQLTTEQMSDIVTFIDSWRDHPDQWQPSNYDSATISVESDYSYEETMENLHRAIIGKNFRVIRIQPLEDGLFDPAEQHQKQTIVYFCNFNMINQALNIDPRIGLFMPCRINVIEKDGVVTLSSMNPRFMSRFFNNSELDESCTEMFETYNQIMEEATL